MKKIILLLVVVFNQLYCNVNEPYIIKVNDFNNLKITKEKIYKADGLLGYINGGADLYLEYGFSDLKVQNITIDRENFIIDVYQMSNEKSAYGIFSISKNTCDTTLDKCTHSCINKYHTQFAYKNIYCSIINNSGSAKAQSLSKELANIIIDRCNNKTPIYKAVSYFNNKIFDNYKNDIKYIKGKIALDNKAHDVYDLLESNNDIELYLLAINVSEKIANFYIIELNNPNELKTFLKINNIVNLKTNECYHTKLSDNNISIKVLSDKVILYSVYKCDITLIKPYLDAIIP